MHLLCVAVCRLYDGKILCDFANEIKSGAVSELVRVVIIYFTDITASIGTVKSILEFSFLVL